MVWRGAITLVIAWQTHVTAIPGRGATRWRPWRFNCHAWPGRCDASNRLPSATTLNWHRRCRSGAAPGIPPVPVKNAVSTRVGLTDENSSCAALLHALNSRGGGEERKRKRNVLKQPGPTPPINASKEIYRPLRFRLNLLSSPTSPCQRDSQINLKDDAVLSTMCST